MDNLRDHLQIANDNILKLTTNKKKRVRDRVSNLMYVYKVSMHTKYETTRISTAHSECAYSGFANENYGIYIGCLLCTAFSIVHRRRRRCRRCRRSNAHYKWEIKRR